jgi:imidazoleglycerol-phosphate dehydratase
MKKRTAKIKRKTAETAIEVTLTVDGAGLTEIETGIGLLDHLFESLARHGRFDLRLACRGDLEVDDHHTAEDSALAFGSALDAALGDRRGVNRFGWAYAPLDESLARAVVDLSGRPFAGVNLALARDSIGGLSSENIEHAIRSIAMSSRSAIHVDVLKGENDHHKAEAAFKALALAVKQAVMRSGTEDIPSTKEVL